MTSGRLVEYEGGGDETRSNPWLAELQQDMFIEINPQDAKNVWRRHRPLHPRGNADRRPPESQSPGDAARTARAGVDALPLRRLVDGRGFTRQHYPEGAAPIVRGEAVNTGWSYGYDAVTMMQETKVSLCRLARDLTP